MKKKISIYQSNRIFCTLLAIGLCMLVVTGDGQLARETKSRIVTIVVSPNEHSRIAFAAQELKRNLSQYNYNTKIDTTGNLSKQKGTVIVIGSKQSPVCSQARQAMRLPDDTLSQKEGFTIRSLEHTYLVEGVDTSGALYGTLTLMDSVKKYNGLPKSIQPVIDFPRMIMRAACIGLQKATYLPGRDVYEYPYTEQAFPWFYDKQLWIRVLDSLAENRMNALFLWNGHPFASLVKLKDYPYAVEVDDTTFAKNEEIFRFLTEEADKRGIWIIQAFYNIIVSKPFAEKNHLATQDRNRPIIPIIADYTRKSIAAFVAKYPHVGLCVTLGEAMEGVGQDDIDWFTKTIIPGVKDGLTLLGARELPPIILRAHDTDAPSVMKAAMHLYPNLYTMAKYNGEALTTYEPRGSWAELHRNLSNIGTVHIENVHILANLEPFRYGSADFIQKSVQAMHRVYGARGVHIYPQASYWDWPYSADSANPRLLQIERDWIWYKEWSRYAWNEQRDRAPEIDYWSGLLASRYGCDQESGKSILHAYEESGNIAPKLLRRFGITDGNRQTLTLGMLMTQLINPYRYGLFDLLYDSESPLGEKVIEYAEKDWKQQPHIGETPVQIIKEVSEEGKRAVEAIEKARPFVTKDKKEFERLRNDMYCYQALALHYANKVQAALYVLRYKYSKDIQDLDKALPYLEKSVQYYQELADLTKNTYMYANSMQTKQRKIPIRGVDGTFKTWTEVLVPFQQELAHFKRAIDSLKTQPRVADITSHALTNATIAIQNGNAQWYTIKSANSNIFSDTAATISASAKELDGLKGLRLSFREQQSQGTAITFSNKKPVKVLVGFFNTKDRAFSKAPELETDASANNYGQAETVIANALVAKGFPKVNVHTYSFPAGTNTLRLGKGAVLILGFVDETQDIAKYDAGLSEAGVSQEIDWLFE
ncbi:MULTISPECIES: alpha-d-galacturonidase [Chitinophagaceae]